MSDDDSDDDNNDVSVSDNSDDDNNDASVTDNDDPVTNNDTDNQNHNVPNGQPIEVGTRRTRSGRISRPPARYRCNLSQRKCQFGTINNAFLNSLNWKEHSTAMEKEYGSQHNILDSSGFVESFYPIILAVKANAGDNPNWFQAMNGPQSDGYWEAMKSEIMILEDEDSWEVVDRKHDMNFIPSTWAFRCKRFLDGTVRKLKVRFCVRGDNQKEGVDYFETNAFVFFWQIVRLLLIFIIKFDLCSKQIDYTAAFVQSYIKEEV